MASLSFRFWGVRGSLPASGAHTARYGGNTPCLEVRAGDRLFIVDLGSGVRGLGENIGFGPHKAVVLMTHYHYDHVQGLPFFAPLFNPANEFEIWGPDYEGRRVRELLADHLIRPYFPVGLEVLRAKLSFHDLQPAQTLNFGDVVVKSEPLFHPQGSTGFRFEFGGKVFVYCTDIEHDGGPWDARLTRFAEGADQFVLDAMYTPDEYAGRSGGSRKGFGHATWEFAAECARKAGVKNLVLCHHDPARSDDAVDRMVEDARKLFPATTAAKEGLLVEL